VIETRTITRTLCPVELKLPIPAEVPVPDGAIVRGNQLGMEHIARRFSREELLAARLADAAAECVVPQDAGASLVVPQDAGASLVVPQDAGASLVAAEASR